MKALLISDVDILDGLTASACFIAFVYLFERLDKYRNLAKNPPIIPGDASIWQPIKTSSSNTTTTLIAAALAWCATWYIRRIVGNLYTAIKNKHHLKDRSIYINSALL